ncbi:hypothetical protein BT96DRAFT_989883 [Gymnopus androsaceus JB14]|uniref:GRF-type domain-containing protein n=1 Tax=Gymnopus androsaceus JB14 TaxID=1447944 RepID=A0A6A4I0P0_9AGAR|nr:hypothetical protein BT96DRAFT_989883 [Gymnopus androsaceus JB14]
MPLPLKAEAELAEVAEVGVVVEGEEVEVVETEEEEVVVVVVKGEVGAPSGAPIDIDSDDDSAPAPKPRSTRAKPTSAAAPKSRSTAPAKPLSRTPAANYGYQTLCRCGVPAISDIASDQSPKRYWKCGSTPPTCLFFLADDPNASSSSTRDEIPNYKCGVPAGKRAVTKDNENKGRPIWICEERSCGFFAFRDEPLPPSNSSSAIPAKRTFSNASGGDDTTCNCSRNEPALKLTSRKENANQGREFWRCAKKEGEGQWEVEVEDRLWENAKSASSLVIRQAGDYVLATSLLLSYVVVCEDCSNSDSANKKSRGFGSSGENSSQKEKNCFKPGCWSNAALVKVVEVLFGGGVEEAFTEAVVVVVEDDLQEKSKGSRGRISGLSPSHTHARNGAR